jgi:hypothetical protein
MQWDKSYIIVRPINNYLLSVLHATEKLKDARYWLQHLASPNDAIFITKVHGQYKGEGDPIYMCHVPVKGRADFNESQWEKTAFPKSEKRKYSFLEESLVKSKITPDATVNETEVLELISGKPMTLELEQIQSLLKTNSKQLDILLAEPAKWINWESAMTLMLRDVYVLSVNPESEWPLTITLKTDNSAIEEMDYSSEMKFIVRPRS